MIYVFLAEGFEEIEALAPVDVLRRGGVEVKTVGIGGKTVNGTHGIPVVCDITADEAKTDGLSGVILPGGMPGTINLENDKTVQGFIDFAVQNGLLIGAICAAPSILGHRGLLNGKRAICFPGFEKELTGAVIENKPAVRDGNIITGWGAGGSLDFAYLLLEAVTGDGEKAKTLAENMKYPPYCQR